MSASNVWILNKCLPRILFCAILVLAGVFWGSHSAHLNSDSLVRNRDTYPDGYGKGGHPPRQEHMKDLRENTNRSARLATQSQPKLEDSDKMKLEAELNRLVENGDTLSAIDIILETYGMGRQRDLAISHIFSNPSANLKSSFEALDKLVSAKERQIALNSLTVALQVSGLEANGLNKILLSKLPENSLASVAVGLGRHLQNGVGDQSSRRREIDQVINLFDESMVLATEEGKRAIQIAKLNYAKSIAPVDADSALELLMSLESKLANDGRRYQQALQNSVAALAQQAPEKTVEAIASSTLYSPQPLLLMRAMDAWVNEDFDKSLAWVDRNYATLPSSLKDQVAISVSLAAFRLGDEERGLEWRNQIKDKKLRKFAETNTYNPSTME